MFSCGWDCKTPEISFNDGPKGNTLTFQWKGIFSCLILSLVHSSATIVVAAAAACCSSSYRGFCCYVVNGVRNASGILHVSRGEPTRGWSSILVPTTEFNHIFLEPLGNLTLLYFFPSSFLFFVVIAFQYPKPQNLWRTATKVKIGLPRSFIGDTQWIPNSVAHPPPQVYQK